MGESKREKCLGRDAHLQRRHPMAAQLVIDHVGDALDLICAQFLTLRSGQQLRTHLVRDTVVLKHFICLPSELIKVSDLEAMPHMQRHLAGLAHMFLVPFHPFRLDVVIF
jgi:hypothetical protein